SLSALVLTGDERSKTDTGGLGLSGICGAIHWSPWTRCKRGRDGLVFIVVVILPLLSVGSWWTVRRIWVTGDDAASEPVRIIPTASRAGANATRLPLAICITTGS